MQITDYTLAAGKVYTDVIKRVKDLIKEGWQPQGGVMVDEDEYLIQAMVKHDEPEKCKHPFSHYLTFCWSCGEAMPDLPKPEKPTVFKCEKCIVGVIQQELNDCGYSLTSSITMLKKYYHKSDYFEFCPNCGHKNEEIENA